jgi:hypothetical protein
MLDAKFVITPIVPHFKFLAFQCPTSHKDFAYMS